MVSLIAKGTSRGLKNRGVASGLMWSEAVNGWIFPSSFENRVLCCCKSELSGFSFTVLTVKMLCHSSWMCFSQFLPRRLGPFPLTATSINFFVWLPYCLSHSVSPQPSYVHLSVYVFSIRLEDCRVLFLNKACLVTSDMTEKAVPVSTSMLSLCPFKVNETIIGSEEWVSTLWSQNSSSLLLAFSSESCVSSCKWWVFLPLDCKPGVVDLAGGTLVWGGLERQAGTMCTVLLQLWYWASLNL